MWATKTSERIALSWSPSILARLLGDQHRLGRIAILMVSRWRVTGDYDAALKSGQEALTIARTLGDRSIEVVATNVLGETHIVRGEFSEAAKLLERNIGLLDGKLRSERFGTPVIQSAASGYSLAIALAHLGWFTEAIGHGEAAVRIAEENDHPWTLFLGLYHLGVVHLLRGELSPAACARLSPTATWASDCVAARAIVSRPRSTSPPRWRCTAK